MRRTALAALAALTLTLATGCGTTPDGGQAFNCDTANGERRAARDRYAGRTGEP